MKYLFRRNTKTIQEIYSDFVEGRLFADPSYQRRKVWNVSISSAISEIQAADV